MRTSTTWRRTERSQTERSQEGDAADERSGEQRLAGARVVMHLLGVARTDMRVMREATALSAAGAQVTIVDLACVRGEPDEETVDGVRLRHIPAFDWYTPSRFKPWFLVKIARMLLRGAWALLRTSADVYHAHDDIALPASVIAALARRKPLIFDAHELPLVEPNVTQRRVLCAVARGVLRLLVGRASAVITVSPPLVVELQKRYGGPMATVVRNLPRYQRPAPSDLLRRRLGLGPTTRIALYQGYFSPPRELDRVVRAARFLASDTVIALMGSGVSQPALEALIAAEGVGERVRIVPPAPYDELLTWTASADIGLILFSPDRSPSIRYCLPNKLFEYLMAGTPTLAGPLDAVRETLATYGAGRVVESLAPQDIAAAMDTMLADTAALATMRERALLAAQRDLHWERETGQLARLYGDVIAAANAVSARSGAR